MGMKNKKWLYNLAFIALATIVLLAANQKGWLEQYAAFALLPILLAYYAGQLVERKTQKSVK